jgi:putative flippase GtrA
MTVLVSNPRERSRFMRFAVVGIVGAVVDFGVANLLVYGFQAPLVFAGTISFVAAILNNFIWNRYWTYPDSRSRPIAAQFVQFVVVSVVGLVIRIPILHWLEPLMFNMFNRVSFLSVLHPDILAKNFTLAVAVVVVMFWNFFVNRYWTYSDVE